MDEARRLGKLKAEPNNWESQLNMVQHELTYFENYLSLFIQIISTIWRPTLGTRKLCKIVITYKNFRTEPSGKLLLKNSMILLNSKTSFPFKTVCLYRKLKKITLGKSFATLTHCGDNHNYQTRASTKIILDTPLYKGNNWVFVFIQQNINVLRIETSLKESSLISQKLTILIENLNLL